MRRIRVIYMDGLIETFAVARTEVDPDNGAVLRLLRPGDGGGPEWFQTLPLANIRRWEKA